MYRQQAQRRTTQATLTDKDRTALEQLGLLYEKARTGYDERRSDREATRIRARLIQEANPHAQALSPLVFRSLLGKANYYLARTKGCAVPKEVIVRSCVRQSFGTEGFIPEVPNGLEAHLKGMKASITALLEA